MSSRHMLDRRSGGAACGRTRAGFTLGAIVDDPQRVTCSACARELALERVEQLAAEASARRSPGAMVLELGARTLPPRQLRGLALAAASAAAHEGAEPDDAAELARAYASVRGAQ